MNLISTQYTGGELAITAGRLSGVTIGITQKALEAKQSHLAELSKITSVANADEQASAVKVAREAKGFLKEIESSRETIKRPVAQLAKLIDETAKAYRDTLDAEVNRITGLISNFQEAEAERVRLEEQDRQRQIQEALAEEQKRLAEAQAQAAEQAHALGVPEDEALASNLELAAQERVAEAQQETEALMRAPLAAPERTAGMRVRDVWSYEVTNIHEVYKARPELVRLEINKAVLRDLIGPDFKCPGITTSVQKGASIVV